MAQKTIGFMHSGTFYDLASLRESAVQAYNIRDLYLPQLKEIDLKECDSLLIAGYQHKRFFRQSLPLIKDFLNSEKHKVVIEAENDVSQWLGVREEERPVNFWAWRTGEDLGRRNLNTDHPIWKYFSDESFHWHFHGVLFPPEGAVPLVVVEEDGADSPRAIVYYDNVTFPAQIIVSEMDASFHHGMGFMPGATQHMLRSLRWLAD